MFSSEKRNKKLPACDLCKARRVLCHPQPNGAPCPRCVEKNAICTTTPVPRGRPRKHPAPVATKSVAETRVSVPQHPGPVFQSLNCPELSPEFVAHCFEAIKFIPQYNHPIIGTTSIKSDILAVSYQIHLLPPQSRVLALCIVCAASLASFHPVMLGDDQSRPNSFVDNAFFGGELSNLLSCGVRRQTAYRGLRDEALKCAWEAGILLQPSNENAASCYLLDMMEQIDFTGASRPWAAAYISHIRSMAPHWHAAGPFTVHDASQWAGYFMTEAITSATSRTPVLITSHDQLLLTGPEPPSLEMFLSTLERTSKNANFSVLWTSIRPYLYHVTTLSRQLSETIAGDHARLEPLAEGAVLRFLTSMTMLQSAMALLVERVDSVLENDPRIQTPQPAITIEGTSADAGIRAAAYGVVFSYAGLILPFYRELELRAVWGVQSTTTDTTAARERMRLLRSQTRSLCLEGAREFAKALRRLPRVHYGPTPVQWRLVSSWAEFAVEEAEAESVLGAGVSPQMRDILDAFADELHLLGYSLPGPSTPQATKLLERMDMHARRLPAGRSSPDISTVGSPSPRDSHGSLSDSSSDFYDEAITRNHHSPPMLRFDSLDLVSLGFSSTDVALTSEPAQPPGLFGAGHFGMPIGSQWMMGTAC
ncbi:Zn(2)-C6 fungal-type domain-containing protein [Mycena kentingensis (nom. inval.)]|nr:Zn(2)-C6 fungal-type domain-containing protein [Mycena kentingensis (nom. inval.)]